MKKIRWYISTGAGCDYEGHFYAEDDATEEEIEEMARQEAFNCIDWGYLEVEKSLSTANR